MASNNFSTLEDMAYSGRGIVTGRTPEGNRFVGYTLTGRSPSSQARQLVYNEEHGVVRTDVTDPKILAEGNAALLIYPAIICRKEEIVASNGQQTNLLYNGLLDERIEDSEELVSEIIMDEDHFQYDPANGFVDLTRHEPDSPNFTPRISACMMGDKATLHIVSTVRNQQYSFGLRKGTGKMITTYEGGNEAPVLESYQGDPFDVTIANEAPGVLVQGLYDAITSEENNFAVSAAVMMIIDGEPNVALRNRF